MGSLQIIASANANSGTKTSSFAFTNIPQTYTDLLLYLSLRGTDGGNEGYGSIWLNNQSSGTGFYGQIEAQGAGLSVTVASNFGLDYKRFIIPNSGAGSLEFSATYCYIPNYTVSGRPKSMSISSNQTNTSNNNRNTNEVSTYTGGITNAITQINIFATSGNLAQYSSVYLYGIDSTP